MKFDELKAERDYITDVEMSYRKLAKKYETTYTTIANCAKANDWVRKRKEYSRKLNEQTIEKAIEKQSDCESDNLLKLKDTATNAINYLSDLFKHGYEMDAREFKSAVQSLETLTNVWKNIAETLKGGEHGGDVQTGIIILPEAEECNVKAVVEDEQSD